MSPLPLLAQIDPAAQSSNLCDHVIAYCCSSLASGQTLQIDQHHCSTLQDTAAVESQPALYLYSPIAKDKFRLLLLQPSSFEDENPVQPNYSTSGA